jgi:hypothetical protein
MIPVEISAVDIVVDGAAGAVAAAAAVDVVAAAVDAVAAAVVAAACVVDGVVRIMEEEGQLQLLWLL